MSNSGRRKVEIFSAGCPVCEDAVQRITEIACPSCEVEVLDMHDPVTAKAAEAYGVQRVPAVAVDGKLAPCCAGVGVDEAALRSLGLGQPT